MSQSTDGTFTTALQHGAKQVSLPLQGGLGNNYATVVRRNYIAAPATAFAPAVATRTSYTQLLIYSDDFSNGAWAMTRASGTANSTTDPEGGTTASKFAEDNTATNTHLTTHAMTVAAGATSFGVLVKAAERTFIRLRIQNATDGNIGIAVFNLTTGVVVSGAGAIKQLLNGWYWCSVQATTSVTNSNAILDLMSDGTTLSYSGTTGNGVYVFHATAYLSAAIGPAVATTSVTRAVTVPLVDVDDPLAFLVEEQAPDTSMLELGVLRFSRAFADVPATTTVQKSIMVNLPSIPAATAYDLYTDKILTRTSGGGLYSSTNLFDFSSQTTYGVYGPILSASASLAIPTSGTLAFTYKATTITLNYNDSTAIITAAINGMASIVSDGITVSCLSNLANGNGQIRATIGTWTATPSINGASISPALAQAWDVYSLTATDFMLRTRYYINYVAHGFSDTAKPLMTRTSGTVQLNVISSGNWFIYSADIITIKQSQYLATLTDIAKYMRAYIPGSFPVVVNAITRYSLSAITPDTYQGSGDAFLQAIFAGSTAINYQVGDSTHWPNEMSPINSLTTIQVSAANL